MTIRARLRLLRTLLSTELNPLRISADSQEHEARQSCRRFYLHHGYSRHAGIGADRAGPADAGPRFSWGRRAERGEDVWHFRHGLRVDAVSFLACAGRVVGSLWAAAGDSAFESRTRSRLHRDGHGADADLAFCRARDFWNHRREHYDRDGICGGCGRAGKTGRVRSD